MGNPKYTVVVPVYNSEQTLETLFHRIEKVMEELSASFQVVFVEDCGRDRSWSIVQELHRRHPTQIVAIKLSRNFGQHSAVICGLHYAKGDFIITIDDDLQVPPEEIPKLIECQTQTSAELVYGVYENKRHNLFRNLGSRIIQRIVQFTFDTNGPITSFRLMTSSLAERIRGHSQSFVYIEGLFFWHTENVVRVTVRHESRRAGRSNYSTFKLIKLAINLIFSFTTFPLRVITVVGAVTSLVSFLLGIYFVFRKILYEVPLGYTSLIVSIFFTSSVLLLFLGVIGEYLSRLYSIQNRRPQFSIRQVLGSSAE